jgi:hypothetical protein
MDINRLYSIVVNNINTKKKRQKVISNSRISLACTNEPIEYVRKSVNVLHSIC